MKTTIHSILRPRLPALAGALTLLLLTALPGRAHAQANLTFSGGLGTPLLLTLSVPVTYVITTPPAAFAPLFDFQGVGNVFGSTGGAGVSGTITFTINAGAAQTFSNINSGMSNGNQAATDVYIYGSMPTLAVGNTVVLNAGTLTTTSNFAGAPPASGSYPTFIIDGYGQRLDAVNGVAAPEPSTWALLGLGGAGGLALALRRRRRARLVSGLAALLLSSAVLLPISSAAASASGQTGAQLLQAQLPADTTLAKADGKQLARAVTLATRAHHADAEAILTAALMRHPGKDAHAPEGKLPCADVARLMCASVAAAPDRASALVDLTSSLYPDCADSLQVAAVAVSNDKNVVDGKDSVDGKDTIGRAPAANEPADGSRPASNVPNTFDLGLEPSDFGVGFSPGFPGSPGFIGSAPNGAFALPSPVSNPVTSVTND